MSKTSKILLVIFLIAIFVRFYGYPKNVYFAFDQARDSYFALNILRGDLRLIGPPSAASDKLFPGPLSLYIYSAIYFLLGKSPVILSAFFRILNATGIFLTFLIGSALFGNPVGLLSALLFAISYEQSQYSLFSSHQPLAVIPMLAFYYGLSILIFEKKKKGLAISTTGLALAIQFHYVYVLLVPIFILIIILFKRKIPIITRKNFLISLGLFLLVVSSYIIAEVKFGFRVFSVVFSSNPKISLHFNDVLYVVRRSLHDQFFSNYQYLFLVLASLLLTTYYLIRKKATRDKIIFLVLWFCGGLIPYLLSGTTSYYYSGSAFVSLSILISYAIFKTYPKFKKLSLTLLGLILINNILQIKTQNVIGPNKDIVIQPEMLIGNEEKVLDYSYQNAGTKTFAVKALTIPLNINTTWSYLFEWYGKEKYGFLPIWVGKPAEGFPGNLPYESSRSKLPETQFLIIEPTIGISQSYLENFFKEENYFTKLVEEKKFGTIIVQKRLKI
ncbi:hypothetical protein A3D00_03465 [Candidatus Woesebacteria bacterium RIFCSPHIGHO2_02_FULL_38_9]|uniref:Glycosyltransferase RgtA/B/C/D-like domain-containing protein n=1 Tax=Candidatus Woesebacteria bacterium RIFCSPHIGHO2_01_FULL_39_28 TaxID=1802496 RepID=A0A1F7YJ19_9BACT|nr:MAG: hypothetical protein A2627_00720 [Candidatus Woesebacteria bacterium RIFCSPHIGHO2_01_FULL_39_28]OGM32557.1 MAG: hypothetical protein A3D00_03465 [Candidatus Woesebacteria bacterium RIFCSPHIGHO2_02_FULL_38_9]